MPKQGEEYERFVQDVYKVLNANDGLNDAVVQHNVKLQGLSREHQIDVYWQFSYGTVTYRVAVECKEVPSSIMRKFIYKSGRTPSAQGREPALDYPIAEGRERVKGGEAACEALDVSSVFCYQPASSSCTSRCFMLMYFFPPHWVPAT